MAFRRYFWLLTVLLWSSLPAHAEPITSGSAVLRQFSGMDVDVEDASGSSLRVFAGLNGFPFQPDQVSPGSTVTFSRSWSGSDVDGIATLNGIEYRITEGTPIGQTLGSVASTTGAFETPPLGAGGTATAPFTFVGSFRSQVFGVPGAPDGIETVASASFNGGGTSTLFLVPTFGGLGQNWGVSRIEFAFEDPTAVPEPSTMLLTGLGVAVLGRRVRRRGAPRS